MMAEGVTGRVGGEDAAGDEDGVGGGGDGGGGDACRLPAKVRKMGFRLGSNLAMKELVEVSAGLGKAAPEVAAMRRRWWCR